MSKFIDSFLCLCGTMFIVGQLGGCKQEESAVTDRNQHYSVSSDISDLKQRLSTLREEVRDLEELLNFKPGQCWHSSCYYFGGNFGGNITSKEIPPSINLGNGLTRTLERHFGYSYNEIKEQTPTPTPAPCVVIPQNQSTPCEK